MIVDDDPYNIEVFQILLEYAGLEVDTARDGVTAIEMAQMTDYAAIFMDIQMPNVDGLEATRRIRTMAAHRTTPIIALTGNVFSEHKLRCIAAGMDEFLTKPFEINTVYETLLRSLRQRSV